MFGFQGYIGREEREGKFIGGERWVGLPGVCPQSLPFALCAPIGMTPFLAWWVGVAVGIVGIAWARLCR
jgi:hypothetical protein